MDAIYEVKGKTFDLGKALPLTLGDWEDLENDGVTPDNLQGKISFRCLRIYMSLVFKKLDPTVDDAFVKSLSIDDLNRFNEASIAVPGVGDNSRPSVSGDMSTPSDNSTDGPQT